MSETKHTPGPWKVIKSPHGNEYRCVQYGKDDSYTSLEMLPADARLCAAAPELLSLLKDLIANRSRCFIPNDENLLGWDEKAIAALAKAEDC